MKKLFILGKLYLERLTVEMDYTKSASFFRCAISYGNTEALDYLGKQYEQGLEIEEDQSKAMELYIPGAQQQDPEWLYEVGECYRFSCVACRKECIEGLRVLHERYECCSCS